jgi:NitT/TauT family transport system substrate-binding protein
MKRAICLALVCLAGCGSSGGNSTSSNGSSTVRVQDTAGVPAAFLEYGVSRGYFKQQKLNVKVKPSQGGATVVPAVLSGSVDIGGSNLASVILAKSKNIPVKVIAPGTFTARKDFSAIIVKGNSPIHSPKDLEGKTLAVNTLKNVAELTAKASLAKKGVDVSKIKLTEVDFPDMVGAVSKGRVDAAFAIEPFVSLGLKAGERVVDRPYVGTKPGLQIGCYFTSQKYLSQNGDVVKRFQRGVAATGASIAKDPKAFRDFLPKGSSIPPAAAQKVVLPDWKAKSDPASVALTAQLMQQYGLVKTKPDTKDVLGE